MQDVAICTFAWDFADEGIEATLEFIAELGVNSLFFASVYHAGWFVLPHNPFRTCYMVEDGVAYFHPQSRFFCDTELKPKIAQIAKSVDWFAETGRYLDRFGLQMTAWTVCNHNTRLGLLHPEHTVRNALGDSYPHALTPASPAVRNYVRGLANNLASQYPVQSLFLEAPNYRGRRHGHHHERDLTPFGALELELLDVSFSTFDIAAAAASGIDGEKVREVVAKHLKHYLANVPELPTGMPRTIEEFNAICPLLSDYRQCLDRQVDSLIKIIHDDVSAYGVKLEGVEPVPTYDWMIVGAYGKTLEEVAELTQNASKRLAKHQRLRVGFRLGYDPPGQPTAIASASQCRQYILAATQNGADGIYFYNYSETPTTYLKWIKSAL